MSDILKLTWTVNFLRIKRRAAARSRSLGVAVRLSAVFADQLDNWNATHTSYTTPGGKSTRMEVYRVGEAGNRNLKGGLTYLETSGILTKKEIEGRWPRHENAPIIRAQFVTIHEAHDDGRATISVEWPSDPERETAMAKYKEGVPSTRPERVFDSAEEIDCDLQKADALNFAEVEIRRPRERIALTEELEEIGRRTIASFSAEERPELPETPSLDKLEKARSKGTGARPTRQGEMVHKVAEQGGRCYWTGAVLGKAYVLTTSPRPWPVVFTDVVKDHKTPVAERLNDHTNNLVATFAHINAKKGSAKKDNFKNDGEAQQLFTHAFFVEEGAKELPEKLMLTLLAALETKGVSRVEELCGKEGINISMVEFVRLRTLLKISYGYQG